MSQHLKTAVLCLLLLLPVLAQAQGESLTYSNAVTGSIDTPDEPVQFTFGGAAGDLVIARVTPVTTGLDISLTLRAPDGAVTSSAGDTLTQRLGISGTYTLIVTGANASTGSFIVQLDAEGLGGISVPLPPDQTTRAAFTLDAPPQVFSFEQNPAAQTLLFLAPESPEFRFNSEVRDGDGRLVALFGSDTRETSLVIDAGVGAYSVTIAAADPAASGVVLLRLETGDPVTPSAPLPTSLPLNLEAPMIHCHISTNATANVRSAPSTEALAIDRLTVRKRGDVIGVSADGNWYAVLLATQVGWVAKQVAREVEVCGDLPILDAATNLILPPTPTGLPTNTATTTPTQIPTALAPTRTATTVAATRALQPTDTAPEPTSAEGEPTSAATELLGTPTPLPPSAPRDDDHRLTLASSTATVFNEIISQPVGDGEDHIAVRASGLNPQTNEREYSVLMICAGEAVDLLLWGFDTTEPNLVCGNSTRVTFSRSANLHDFIVMLPDGPALVSYTLTFTPED